MLARYMLSSCDRPSVRLSVTSRCSKKPADPRITQTPPYDSAGTLNFLMPKILAKFQRAHTQVGGGVGHNRWFSTNISPYLRNGARLGVSPKRHRLVQPFYKISTDMVRRRAVPPQYVSFSLYCAVLIRSLCWYSPARPVECSKNSAELV